MASQYARQTAIPCTLHELQSGDWVQNTGLAPSGVKTPRAFISRANILGIIVSMQEDAFIIEDGTGAASVRSFGPMNVSAHVGDMVLVVARPREFNNERYLALEICKKLRSPAWIAYRKKELELLGTIPQPPMPQQAPASPVKPVQNTAEENSTELIIARIRALDNGTGVMVDDLLSIPQAEKYVRTLLEEGEIFEIKPGRVKVLE